MQVDVRGGFSPSCCSTTPFQFNLACDLVFWSCMLLGLYITFLWYGMYLLVFTWINRALGLKRAAPKVCVFSCWDKLRFRGEMVLLPNDEEVANSSKKHTQFKTRVHKPYPFSDQNGRNWYPISDQNSLKKHTLWRGTYLYSLYKGLPSPSPPPGAKNALQIVSLASYSSETNKWQQTQNIKRLHWNRAFSMMPCWHSKQILFLM